MNACATDVLIIGGSMAGSCLARSLKLQCPELDVTVLEKKSSFDHGIGESMLEIFWDYASKDLKLSKYLESNYYYKHGLRFFFEKDDKNSSLVNMSEMGRTWYHAIPAHQINRAKFDEDLVVMNSDIGVITERGIAAVNVEIGDFSSRHTVQASNGLTYKCKWLVDASGFSGFLSRQFRDVEKLEEHPVSAAWVRIKNMRDIDDLGDDAWRERVHFTNRSLSTNHFMYRGYWIWLIPLDAKTYSIGVVWHHNKSNLSIKNKNDLEQFFLSHRWAKELFGEEYEIVDFGAMKNMARIARTIFSKQRWFRTGMAAGFIDPLFSSGSAWLTDINRMIVDIIKSDLQEKPHEVERKVGGYDFYAHWWYDNFLLHITGNYHGNYDLHKVLFKALLMDYFGIVMPASVSEYWRSFSNLDEESLDNIKNAFNEYTKKGGAAFAHKIKDELNEFLEKTGIPLKNNIGNFHDVEIPSAYMLNSFMRGRGLSQFALQNVRRQIEAEALLEASKVASAHRGTCLSQENLEKLRKQYMDGEIANLTRGLDFVESINREKFIPAK